MDHAPVADRTEPAPAAGPGSPPASGRCPVDHEALAAASAPTATAPPTVLVDVDPTPSATGCPVAHDAPAPPPVAEPVEAARCPIPHVAAAAPAAAGCPVLHGPGGVRRSPADLVVRKVLRIKERPAGVTDAAAYSTFQRSMLISATRCTLTYVVFPFVLPAAGFASGVGPIIGILIGSLALVCDTFTIRRFFAVDHKWRWHFSAIAFAIMCLLTVLLVQDLAHVIGRLVT